MYEDLHKINGSFSPSIPGLQIHWDSTCLGLLKSCPRKYQYTMLDNWSSYSIHLDFGIRYHEALEHYEKFKHKLGDHTDAVRETVREILNTTWIDGKPWESPLTHKTRTTLIRSVVWYLEQFGEDPTSQIIILGDKPAVELSFSMDIPDFISPDGEPYTLAGHLDRVIKFGGESDSPLYIEDHKTTKTALSDFFFGQFNPNNQVSLYILAGKIVFGLDVKGMLIAGCQLGVNYTRFQRGIVNRTDSQLKEWLQSTISYIKQAEAYAIDQYWPMNDTACTHYGNCPFKDICSRDPSLRERFLKSDFSQREPWDPTKKR